MVIIKPIGNNDLYHPIKLMSGFRCAHILVFRGTFSNSVGSESKKKWDVSLPDTKLTKNII